MKQLNEQQLQTHVTITGWLLIAHSMLGVIGGLIVFALIMSGSWFFTELMPVVNDPEGTRIFTILTTINTLTAVLIGGLVIGLSLPALVAGIGVLARKSWARILGIIVAVFALISFPIGTLIGIYVIFVLMQDAATNYFASSPAHMQTAPHPT
jgi:hypothetical protein